MSKRKKELDFEESSGNVFADLGETNAEEYLAKAKLAHQINQIIKEKKLNQTAAAKLLGIDQPKISALANGRLSGFSLERLFRFLKILHQDIVITLKPHNETAQKNSQHIFIVYENANKKYLNEMIDGK